MRSVHPCAAWEEGPQLYTKCVLCSEAVLDCTVNAHCAWDHGATFIESTQTHTTTRGRRLKIMVLPI
eukprot:SAG25_NODE_1108_length_3951_cov_1.777259_7_plen_67_part_00